jgi:leader peptidase (prepilin peptidase)/N-methyltransferase
MTPLQFLRDEPTLFFIAATLFGLVVGSFLNVVIHRLPTMMRRRWEAECRQSLGIAAMESGPDENLFRPRSRCPHCGHGIRAIENVPVLSFIFLRGRCSACHASISIQYPLVELLSGGVALTCAVHYGFGFAAVASAFFGFALIALSAIDLRTQLLPDSITLPLMWGGLLVNLGGTFSDLQSAVIGAMAGYLALWIIYQVFKRLTGKEGMGYGDFKLLAALGAWSGWHALPLIVLLSSTIGAVVGIALIAARRLNRDVPIPFGPYLAAAGWIGLLYGPSINDAYLGMLIQRGP